MNKTLIIPVAAFAIVSVGLVTASATQALSQPSPDNNGGRGYQKMIETKAKILDMSVEELKASLETRTFLDIAEEKGVSEEQLHAEMQSAARQRWSDMGLSDSEIKSREQRMQERQSSTDHTSYRGFGRMHSN